MKTATVGGLLNTLNYDPLGRLWQVVTPTKTIEWTYDGDSLVMETNGTTSTRYVHGPGDDDPMIQYNGTGYATRYSLEPDYQGSIVSVADATGAKVAIDAYDEYGITPTANYGRFQYTGQAWVPQLGLYYYKARMYSPTLGRFMQTDPIGYKDQNNLYAYVGNDPIDGRDPSGKEIVVTGSKEDMKTFTSEIHKLTGLNVKFDKNGKMSVTGKRDRVGSSVAAKSLTGAINAKASISMGLVNNKGDVLIDSFATNEVDVADIAAFSKKDTRLGGEALTHFTEERRYAAEHGGTFDEAHAYALRKGAAVFGALSRRDTFTATGLSVSFYGKSDKPIASFNININPDGSIN